MGLQRFQRRWRYVTWLAISHQLNDLHCWIEIHVPATQTITHFEIDPDMDHFEAANALWDKIDDAFDDLDSDL